MATRTTNHDAKIEYPSQVADLHSVPDGENARGLSILDLAIVLVERKRVILWTVIAFTIVAAIVSFLLPKKYTATVTVLAPQQNNSMGSLLASQLGNLSGLAAMAGGSLNSKTQNDMYVGMLRGRTVEDAMIQRFGLMSQYHKHNLQDTRQEFEKYSDVDGTAKDGMIHISVEDHTPERAAELANGYVDELRTLSKHLAITEASQRRFFFEQQLAESKDNLADAEEDLKKTEQTTGLIELNSQARALIESAALLRAQIAAKEVQIQAMQTYASKENPQLVIAQQELAGLRSQQSQLTGKGETAGGLIVPKGMVPQAGLEYVRKLREVKYRETVFEILAKQFEMAKLDEAKEGSLIQIVDAAVPPDKRSFPKRTLIVAGAAIVGFLVGTCVAFFFAGLEHLMSKPESSAKLVYIRRMVAWNARRANVRAGL